MALEWWEQSTTRSIEGQIVDISNGGVFVQTESPEKPSIGHDVLIRVVEPASTPWVSGRIARHDQSNGLGIQFGRPCPKDVFQAVVLGIGFGNLLS